MNSRTKKRLIIVTLAIVAVLVLILAIVGGGTTATKVGLAEAASPDYVDKRIQVAGKVVPNSYTTSENEVSFTIYQAPSEEEVQNASADAVEEDRSVTLNVVYDGGVAATFGNDVEAICTGKMGEDGILYASELVTKCPSKYESAQDALEVSRLLDYGESVVDKTVKVHGTVVAGTQKPVGSDERFRMADASDPTVEISVIYEGALSEDTLADGAALVLTGDLNADGTFSATDISIENQ